MKAVIFVSIIFIVNLYIIFSELVNQRYIFLKTSPFEETDSEYGNQIFSNLFYQVKENSQEDELPRESKSKIKNKVTVSSSATNYIWKSVLFIGMVVIFH